MANVRALDNLIKLARSEVDQARQRIGELERHRDGLAHSLAELDATFLREQALAASDVELARVFPLYAIQAKERRQLLVNDIMEADRQLETARDELSEHFLDMKKYEITRRNRLAEEAAKRAREEQAALDEMGMNLFLRQRQQEGDSG